MKPAIVLAFVILMTATAFAQKENDRLQQSCGNRDIKLDVHTTKPATDPNVEAGKSQVYVVEIAEPAFPFDARKITIRIGLDGKWVGAVKGTHTYMQVAVTSGEHHLCAERQSVQASLEREAAFISFTAEPDQRYYFRARFTEHSGVKLDPVNADEGRLLISSSRLTTSTPKR